MLIKQCVPTRREDTGVALHHEHMPTTEEEEIKLTCIHEINMYTCTLCIQEI